MQPLSLPQQSIYLDALVHGATTKHNMGGAIVIRGPLDTLRFRQSLQCALAVHDVQRLRLHLEGDVAMQEFVSASECPCPYEELDFSDCVDPLQSATDWVLADFRRPMRLDEFPLHGDVLFRLGHDLHLWYPKFHHIAYDAFGHSLITGTVAAAYNQLLQSGTLPAFEPHSYADFLQDDCAYAASGQFLNDQAFWQAKFPAMPQPLPFTARKGELTGDVLRTERCTLAVNRLDYNSIVNRTKEIGVTPFQFLLAGLFAYLSRISDCDDIVVGTPILNRSNHAFRRTAGMFMNMMPLRIRIDRNATVFGLAAQISAETRACYRHQRFPLGETLRYCRSRDGFCHDVFDVTVVYRKLDYGVTFGGSPLRVTTLDTGARDETLSLEIDEYNEGEDVNLSFNFNPQLISTAEAVQMSEAFKLLLADVALNGDRPLCEIRLMPDPAPAAHPRRASSSGQTVVEMLERRAIEAPSLEAVVCGEERMIRGELDRVSSCVAAFLSRDCATVPEQPVAVLCDRDIEWIAAMVGVVKSGCAYLPLDPDMPRARLHYILRDSGCGLLLAGAKHQGEVFEGVRVVSVAEACQSEPTDVPAKVPTRSLAYIIYTSGTTGHPKGVLIEHGSLANTISELIRGWEIATRDRVLEFAAPMFDASLVDIFLALASGAPLVIATKEAILEPARFLDLLRREAVTVATLPPAYLSALGRVELRPLRLLVTAGEAANPADVARQVRYLTFVNAYGPTETSVCASYLKLDAGTDFNANRVSIGKAIGQTQVLILDESLRPLPAGAAGEICITGAGLARGYLNLPELTSERFVANPLRQGERLYRTGDVGRVLPDGNIEFLGRRDTQVKIRGYRVELGEVETALKTDPAVATAVVKSWTSDGASELAAYVVPRGCFEPRELRRRLASRLPAYMLPSRWIQVASVPLNSCGKVNLDALPDPGSGQMLTTDRCSTAPHTPVEMTLVGIWKEVLGLANVGTEDDFFEIGGHSLKAVRVLSRIQHRIGVRIEFADLFSNPTVSGVAALIGRRAPSQDESIPVTATQDSYPLSNAQARVWVLAQMEGGLAAYNMPLALALDGLLDEGALERAFQAVIARHESLRTCFITVRGIPRQKILSTDEVLFDLGHQDLSSSNDAESAARLQIREQSARPFDLSQAPLMRASVLRVGDRRCLLSLVVHHIIADGWSLDVLLRELAICYVSYTQRSELSMTGSPFTPNHEQAMCSPGLGREGHRTARRDPPLPHGRGSVPASSEQPLLPALPIQYRDYSQWMAQRLERDALHLDRAYWAERLAGPLPVLNLPTDFPRPPTLGFAGATAQIQLPRTADLSLPQFCARQGVSPFMVLLTGVFSLLHRYAGDEDMVIGIPVANRERLELEGQIGLYANTLALRVRVGRESTLLELLDRVRTAVLEAQEHQSYPFDSLIQDLKVQRSTNRNPLFDVMAVMQDAVRPEFIVPGIHGSMYPVPTDASVFDLTFHFSPGGAGIRLDLEYNTALWGRPRVERMAGHLDRLIESIVACPETRLADVDMLSAQERRTLSEFSDGPALAAPQRTVIDLFDEQARRNPGHTAVRFEERSLGYGELSATAASLAAKIRRSGIAPGSVVALVAERSEWMVAGVIGIMASGAACLPIDANEPRERMERILADSGCKAVVADVAVTASGALPVLTIRDDLHEQLICSLQLSDVAYITYTSGSTGAPKGSLIEHRSLANLVNALGPCLYDALPQPATELLLTSVAFDVAMKQIFGALTRGNTIEVASDAMRYEPVALMAAVTHGGIHLLDLTPSHFAVLLAHGFASMPKPSLRAIVLGSESLPGALVEDFAQQEINRHIALYNFYGPSECTVEALYCRLDGQPRAATRIAPIGRPIANARAYVVSADGGLLPIGIAGEICLGGAPVGRGYLNHPELTAARFVADPFHAGERMYRTGDLGRWTAAGDIEFLGRKDAQLKIRGYRIEPGEVEYHLREYPGVFGAVVEGRVGPAGSTELVAWFSLDGSQAEPTAIRRHLGRFLPHYMVPARLVEVPFFPVLPNGKIDRKALPDPWTRQISLASIARLSDLESAILAIWQAALGYADIGRCSSFFECGGNSLLLVCLHAMLEERFPDMLKLGELFSASTIVEQARLIEERSAHSAEFQAPEQIAAQHAGPREGLDLTRNGTADARESLVHLGGSGSRKLFCIAPSLGSCSCYREIARQLSAWEVCGLDFIDSTSPAAALADVLSRAQPSGGFALLGYSLGGNLAYEVAQRLAALGRTVSALVLIDSWRRLELFRFTAVQARKNAEEHLYAMGLRDTASVGYEELVRRVESYDSYIDSRMEDRRVECPIHLIRSESNDLHFPFRMTREGWSELTSDFHVLPGSGQHMEMLETLHADRNSGLVQRILESMTATQAIEPKAVRA